MDLVKRNAEIVALVKARKMPMREIAARYHLSTSSISLIAIRHGVHAQAADPKKVRAASKLIQRGMPLRHVAQTSAFTINAYVTSWQSKASTRYLHQMVGPGASTSYASCAGLRQTRTFAATWKLSPQKWRARVIGEDLGLPVSGQHVVAGVDALGPVP